jgi:xylulose-5-phosphate/fructose-6-phosphate phosphoketolase
MHQAMAATLDQVVAEIRQIQADAREHGVVKRPSWPMIVLRTPKGWTCPREIDGKLCEGYWRSHQVPMATWTGPSTSRCSSSGCGAIGPRSCFDQNGRLVPELAALAPKGERRMSANPHANGGVLLRDLRLPTSATTRSTSRSRAR